MKNKVRVIDTLSYSTFHEVFNSSVVYMCTLIFSTVQLRCSSSAKQTNEKLIKRHDPNCNFDAIEYKSLKVIERDDTLGGFIKYLLSGWTNFLQLLITPKSCQLVYTNNNPISLWWVTSLNLLLKKNVAIFCHGELDLLIRSPKPWKPSFYYKYIFKLLFKYGIIGKHTKMFVLGDSILKNLQPFLNKQNKQQFYSIEHPYFFIKRNSARDLPNSTVNIGTVGALTYAKGLQTLLDISKKINPQQVRLTVVGRVMEDIDFEEYPNITFLGKPNAYIPRDEYENGIESLDYILFLYPTDSYGFIASGAIFDAMDMGKPLISLQNDYFQHILKCPIGYVANCEEEITKIICTLPEDEKRKADYAQFLENIGKLKQYFTPEAVSTAFNKKLQ